MRNKSILIISFVIIVGVVSYLFYFRNQKQHILQTPAVQNVDWASSMPEIKEVIKKQFPTNSPGGREVGIYKEADITGDGIPEALVYTGSGGAYTDELVLIEMKDGKPVLAQFKNEGGDTLPLIFLLGASVRHGEAVDISAKDHTVFLASWSLNDNGKMENCEVLVYLWNSQSQLFEYDKMLSDGAKLTFCASQS